MSLQAMVQVIDFCPEKGGEYSALIALANRADADGGRIWYDDPRRLAREARMTPKNFEIVLGKLLASGRVSIMEKITGPRGCDLLQIHFPATKLTEERWEQMMEARVLKKRAEGKTLKGKPRAPRAKKTVPGTGNEKFSNAGSANLSQNEGVDSGTNLEEFSPDQENFSAETPPPAAPSAAEPVPYGPFTVLSSVVIDVVGDEGAPAPGPDTGDLGDDRDHNNPDEIPETDDGEDLLLDALVGGQGTPDGVAADAAGSHDPSPSLNSLEGVGDAETATEVEEVPAGPAPARGEPSQPGEAVYERLKELCGGSIKTPYLIGLLQEQTRGGLPRREWLRLSLPEIEDARVAARGFNLTGHNNFRTALIEHLDAAVDGPQAPPAAPPRPSWITAEEDAGLSSTGARAALPFALGDRVLHGTRYGTVTWAFSDARQTHVEIRMDGDVDPIPILPAQLRDYRVVTDAPPPPPPPSGCVVYAGSLWKLHQDGRIVTVQSVTAGRPTTDDGKTWPAFGKSSLPESAERIASEGTHGAA